jgi:hypothetical protein
MRRPVRDGLALAILLFLTLGIGVLDCAVGRNVSLWFVYALPITLAATIGGARAGLGFSALAAGLLVMVGMDTGHPFPTQGYFFFEVFGDFFIYLLLVALSLGVREQLHKGLGELLPSPAATQELQRVVARQHENSSARSG